MRLPRSARHIVYLGLLLVRKSSALAEDHAEVEPGSAAALELSAAVTVENVEPRRETLAQAQQQVPRDQSIRKKRRAKKKMRKRKKQAPPAPFDEEGWQGDRQEAPYPMNNRIVRRMKEAREETAQMLERRAEKEHAEVLKNRADLKREYYEKIGKELTDAMIDVALDEAWEERPKWFENGHKLHLVSKIPGLEEHYTPPSRKLRSKRMLQVNEVTQGDKGMLVSALSPGWDWNYGMNEFLCVGFDQIKPSFLPKPRQKVKMVDCQLTPALQTGMKYTSNNDIVWQNTDKIFWDWCVETNKVRNGMIRVDTCKLDNPLQQWLLVHVKGQSGKVGDGTWRSLVDENYCVTGKPSKAGRQGGGRLKMSKCTSRGKRRMAQTWIWCKDINSKCEIEVDKDNDSGYIDCSIKTECDIVKP
mmetsp:Transcript_42481/g.128915  ORF Transcript_42481/g.128915 Transcript_42481/m.128915 type:complete len:416 (-) Transcript_42481:271-1518(-)|eukprot:CAMPEP_0113590706 /NCGR_PEP_ID=MMETSP0015_2-20120614/36833_1 /TAXON_ID=2838 /ORGANISM="Odontella" /LENGTH=415 /DNA_ID=CAMNT_0000496947 /DNA_START=334 /DNA_END=1581 /DNA_ORIENTATION=+ /assembly_acc=CAM_ASM_000160